MNALRLLAMLWLLAAMAQSVGWWWQRRHSNAGIVDAIWAASVGAANAIRHAASRHAASHVDGAKVASRARAVIPIRTMCGSHAL